MGKGKSTVNNEFLPCLLALMRLLVKMLPADVELVVDLNGVVGYDESER